MSKISVALGLNFALALLAAIVSGLAAGLVLAMLTVGWLLAWQRKLFEPETIFRILSIQFCICNMLLIWRLRT